MILSLWYSTKEKQPKETGYYLAVKSYWLGDDSVDVGYYHYHRGRWTTVGNVLDVKIAFWTDVDIVSHLEDTEDHHIVRSPAEEKALQAVYDSIEKYRIIKKLSETAT